MAFYFMAVLNYGRNSSLERCPALAPHTPNTVTLPHCVVHMQFEEMKLHSAHTSSGSISVVVRVVGLAPSAMSIVLDVVCPFEMCSFAGGRFFRCSR